MPSTEETYFDELRDALLAAYPGITFIRRAEDGIMHFDHENFILQVGPDSTDLEWHGRGNRILLTGYMEIIWRADRPEHHNFYTSWDAANSFSTWMNRRTLPSSAWYISIRSITPLPTFSGSEQHFVIVWTDKLEASAQFEYEGHLIGPDPDTYGLGIVTAVKVEESASRA